MSNAKHRTTECQEETRVKVINPPELYHSQYLGPGDLEVQLATLIDVTTDESLPIGHLGKNRLSVNLRATPPLRVHFVLIRYTATAAAYPDPQTYVASDLDLRLINSWLARAYPIAGVSSTNVIVDSNYTVPFDCNKTKWVTHLVRELDRRISGQIGRKECVHFTIDHQLNGYEQLDEQIRTAIRESSIFLLIGSNGYLASDWCMNQELSQFLGDFGGERIFIVEKMPYNRAALPRPVANRVGRAS